MVALVCLSCNTANPTRHEVHTDIDPSPSTDPGDGACSVDTIRTTRVYMRSDTIYIVDTIVARERSSLPDGLRESLPLEEPVRETQTVGAAFTALKLSDTSLVYTDTTDESFLLYGDTMIWVGRMGRSATVLFQRGTRLPRLALVDSAIYTFTDFTDSSYSIIRLDPDGSRCTVAEVPVCPGLSALLQPAGARRLPKRNAAGGVREGTGASPRAI
jgi:hypothetical protein